MNTMPEADDEHEEELAAVAVGTGVELVDRGGEYCHEEDGVDEDAHIVGQVEAVDEQKFEPLCHLHEAWDEAGVAPTMTHDTPRGHERAEGALTFFHLR